MKRFVLLALVLAMSLGLMACGSQTAPATESSTASLTYKDVASFIKSQLESQFKYTEITYDETGMTIFLSLDNISTTCALAKYGNAEMAKSWNSIIDSTEDLAESVTESFRSIGCKDYVVSIVIANESNFGDILAMFLNGELVYNAAA